MPSAVAVDDLATAELNFACAHAVLRTLKSAGMNHVVLCPGSRNTPLILAADSLWGSSAYVVVDERAAGFFALGIAKSSGLPVALICTSGSAGAHVLPAMIEASHSAIPLIVVSADRPGNLQHCDAPQTTHQGEIFSTHVRRRFHIEASQSTYRRASSITTQLLTACIGPDRGPGHLNIGFAEPLWKQGVSVPEALTDVRPVFPKITGIDLPMDILGMIARAKRPIIVMGPSVDPLWADAALSVVELARAWRCPVIADPLSQLRSPAFELGYQLIAAGDTILRSTTRFRALDPDLVIRCGLPPTSKAIGKWMASLEANTILVDPAGRLRDPSHRLSHILVGSMADFARAASKHARHAERGWLERWQNEEMLSQGRATAVRMGLWEGPLWQTLLASMGSEMILHVGSSMPVRDLDTFGIRIPCPVYGNRGVNGIDGGIATSCGEAVGGDVPMVAVIGDVAFAHDASALQLAASLDVNMTLILLDNGGGHIFDYLPVAAHRDKTLFQRAYITKPRVDWEFLCKAYGVRYLVCADLDAFKHTIDECFERRGVDVVHIKIDPENSFSAHQELWHEVHND